MRTNPFITDKELAEEILALVRRLHETQERLLDLTGDASVPHPGGQSRVLHEAQKKLRLSETAQRQSADTMMATLNALPAHIALLNSHGVIISVNDIWKRFATANGLQGPEYCLEQNYVETCERATGNCAEEAHLAAAGIRAVLNGKTGEFALEYPCHSQTKKRWFELRVTPVRAGGAVVMHIDITKRKLDDELMRQSEERFRSIFEATATGIAISTLDGHYLQANEAYCGMLGYTQNELLKLNFADVTHPEDLTRNLKTRDELLAGQRDSFVMEKRYLRKDGSIMWARASVSATHGLEGELATLVVMSEDVTERVLAETALRESEQKYRWKTAFFEAQVNSALDGILIVDSGEPFFTTKDLSEGTGLGLSTVMAIVKSHRGMINVYSEPGRGTTFKVYLPAIGISANTTEQPAQKSILPRGEGKTVLVIEDEASILTITSKTLRAFGYKVLTASDGAEGLGLYAQHRNEISVVLTDMTMPVMNGLATIRALLRINSAIKVVTTSGLNANEDAKKLSEMGVKYSLVKPYTAETLLTVLDRILAAAWMPEVRRLQVRQLESERPE